MSDFSIDYIFGKHGWATVQVQSGHDKFESSASYLHNSLKDLAQLAIDLRDGKLSSQALFMAEPGELAVVINVENGFATCEARWFNDWASWGMHPEDDYAIVVKGTNSVKSVVFQISNILKEIHDGIGLEEYKRRWIEHDFPIDQYRSLIAQ